jgi:hypothetical protein
MEKKKKLKSIHEEDNNKQQDHTLHQSLTQFII